MTPLHHITHFGDLEAVRLLVDAGANVNASASNRQPLLTAAAWHHLDIVRLLLQRGANPHGTDRYNHGALDHALVKLDHAAHVRSDVGRSPTVDLFRALVAAGAPHPRSLWSLYNYSDVGGVGAALLQLLL